MRDRHFNGLTPAEAERLAILAEECGEAVQIIGKILRHGYHSYHPDDPNGPDNRAMLVKELGDVHCVMDLMAELGDFNGADVHRRSREKRLRLQHYTHHQDFPEVVNG